MRYLAPAASRNPAIFKGKILFHYLICYLAPSNSRNPAIFKGKILFHYLMRYLAPSKNSRNPAVFKGKTSSSVFRIRRIRLFAFRIRYDLYGFSTLFGSTCIHIYLFGSGSVFGMRIRIQEHVN